MRFLLLKPWTTNVFALLRRCRRDTRGMAVVEFAMLLPFLFFLLVGTVEISQVLTIDRRVTQIASSTADLVAREKTITTAEINNIMTIARVLMEPYDPTLLRITLLNVGANITNASNTKVCWSYNFQGGANTYADNAAYTLPAGVVDKGSSVMVAEVHYYYTPLIFKIFVETALDNSSTAIQDKFYLKPRQSAMIQYNGSPLCVVT